MSDSHFFPTTTKSQLLLVFDLANEMKNKVSIKYDGTNKIIIETKDANYRDYINYQLKKLTSNQQRLEKCFNLVLTENCVYADNDSVAEDKIFERKIK